MASENIVDRRGEVIIPDPPLPRLFASTKMAWVWLIVRVFLGWQWLESGWGRISGGTWASGEALKGFWHDAVQVPEQDAHRSPTAGIATSSSSCSTMAGTPGPMWSCGARR